MEAMDDAAVRPGDVEAPRGGSGGDDDAASTTPSSSALREEEEGKGAAAAAAPLLGAGEDELQVERFYALLANVRALRGMYKDAAAVAGVDDGDDLEDCRGGPSRKRARRAEPPWRPTFRMEDFEEAGDDAGCSRKKQRGEARGVGKRRPGKEAAADEEEGEVVEGKERAGPPRRSAAGRTLH